MSGAGTADDPGQDLIIDLVPVVRRVVAARVRDAQLVDDLVQETLARVMAARHRIEGDSLAPYAVVTARNLVASSARDDQRTRRLTDFLASLDESETLQRPDEGLLREESRSDIGAALSRLPSTEREMLLAHEVGGKGTAALAAARGTTPGAVAAHLSRARAKLRVEYLLVQQRSDPPTDRCRPVLIALSAGDRRRQRELDTGGHLLACDYCSQVGPLLLERRPAEAATDEVHIPISTDADVVIARQRGREIAARAGFSGTDLTLIATAISEIARNIIKFARRGQVSIRPVAENDRTGVTIVVRDAGPGIPDVRRALKDGYSTYGGLGLGLPGSKRLMDEFDVVSEIGKGTTVTMTKWRD